MTTVLLISNGVLWLTVLMLAVITTGMLRQIGLVRQAHEPSAPGDSPESDAAIGDYIPDLHLRSHNNHGTIHLRPSTPGRDTLLLFMSPLCSGCQELIPELNTTIPARQQTLHTVLILTGEQEAVSAFLAITQLDIPTIVDHTYEIMNTFGVHGWPYGHVYDAQGSLTRKGFIDTHEKLTKLLGDTVTSPLITPNPYYGRVELEVGI
jgi:methylamine dehydrogenase accessory protein MauD